MVALDFIYFSKNLSHKTKIISWYMDLANLQLRAKMRDEAIHRGDDGFQQSFLEQRRAGRAPRSEREQCACTRTVNSVRLEKFERMVCMISSNSGPLVTGSLLGSTEFESLTWSVRTFIRASRWGSRRDEMLRMASRLEKARLNSLVA